MSKVYDLNRMRKTYPLVRKAPRYAKLDDAKVETNIIDMSDGQPVTYTFANQYFSVPVCIVTSENENVNVFLSSVTRTEAIIELSSEPIPGNQCLVHIQVFRHTELES